MVEVDLSNLKPGQLVDRIKSTQQRRYALQHRVNDLKSLEHRMEAELLARSKEAGVSGFIGRRYRGEFKEKSFVVLTDFEKFVRWCLRTKSLDCITKKVNSKGVLERLDDGKKVPGVVRDRSLRLSLNKR